VDVYDASAGDLGYTPDKTKNTAYETCDNTVCHGSISRTWGDTAAGGTCGKCHGDPATGTSESQIAPPNDTAGDTAATDPDVGAHYIHLTSNLQSTAPIVNYDMTCDTCHTKPTGVFDSGHIDTALPAELTFGSLATNNGATPTWSTPTCTNTYCHNELLFPSTYHNGEASYGGSDPTPDWNDTAYQAGGASRTAADCGKCHFYNSGSLDCQSCHPHVGSDNLSFDSEGGGLADHMNGTPEGAGGCIGCHTGSATDGGVSDRGNDGVRAIVPEFTDSGGGGTRESHHITGVALTDIHCGQCHCEGDSAGDMTAKHKNGIIDLRDVDSTTCNNNGTDYYEFWSSGSGYDWVGLDSHCLSCHDSNGANGTGGWVGNASNPFNDTLTNTYDAIARGGVLDVASQFTTTNYSHHAVLGARYTGQAMLANSLFSSATPLRESQSVRDSSVLTCGDCHTAGDAAIGGHGSINEYMLRRTSAEATYATDAEHTATTYVCQYCHLAGHNTNDGGTSHKGVNGGCFIDTAGSTGYDRSSPANANGHGNIIGMTCGHCHNSGATGWGGIHGGNSTYTDGDTGATWETRRFMPGMSNYKYDAAGWTGAAGDCYTDNAATVTGTTLWGGCYKHGTGGKAPTRIGRPTEY
jgi:hypothetical protein